MEEKEAKINAKNGVCRNEHSSRIDEKGDNGDVEDINVWIC